MSAIKYTVSQTPHQHKDQYQHVSRPACLRFTLWLLSIVHHPRRSTPLRCVRHALPKGASCVCSGSSTSATEASVNAPSNQPHHLSYDNAAYAGSEISIACYPPSRCGGSMTSSQTFIAEKDQEVAPKLDGLIPSSMTSIPLASTPTMLPR